MSLSILSIDSWESDRAASEHLTTDEADRKFMRQFNKPTAKRQSQDSETLSTYKGSDVSSDSIVDDTKKDGKINTSQHSITSSIGSNSNLSCPELVTNFITLPNQKFTNSHHVKNIKKLRKLNNSVKETTIPVTLPNITPKIIEPWQLEGFHAWSQLDGLNSIAPVNETVT